MHNIYGTVYFHALNYHVMGLLIHSIFIFVSSSTIRKLLIDSDKEDKLLIDSDKEDTLIIDSDKEDIDLNLAMWGLPLNGVSNMFMYIYILWACV